MPYELLTVPYNRELAVDYANYWAYRRNPDFYSFDQIGGDCTNFVSQAIYAANGVMNFTPTYGWYYISVNDRAPAWTGVSYLYNFLTSNSGPGPFGREVPLSEVQIGDVIQFVLKGNEFGHTVIVTSIQGQPTPETVLIAAHDNNANCRQVATYAYTQLRVIHIDGVRYVNRTDERIPRPIRPAENNLGGFPETELSNQNELEFFNQEENLLPPEE